MTWLSLAVVLAGGFTAGWYVHRWYCRHRLGCPLWALEDSAEWTEKLKAEGWETSNGQRHHVGEQHERHPTTEIATPPPVDSDPASGVPLPAERRDTPSAETKPANPARRTT